MRRSIDDDQAEQIKALAHAGRLAILRVLGTGERTATELTKRVGLSKANLSQHIKLLKHEGIVRCVKRGTFCHYSIADARIVKALDLLEQARVRRTQAVARRAR